MGCYLNPRDGSSKEEWLNDKGLPIDQDQVTRVDADVLRASGLMLVCLVYNADFTAAMVAYDDRQKRRGLEPSDPRPKKWYLCTIPDLLTASADLGSHLAE